MVGEHLQSSDQSGDDTSIFNTLAGTYAEHAERNPVNRLYDRPTILRLLGDISSKRVLELGCAAGGLTSHLVSRGADVIALDAEPKMIALARQRIAGRVRFEVADLARQPLTMAPDGSVDAVAASLVLHYIEDWMPLLHELYRCLVPGGALVFSLHHPITGWVLSDQSDYHATELVSETWDWDGLPVIARLHRRPLSRIFGDLRETGFMIDVVEEPRIDGEPGIDPNLLWQLNTQPFFLYLRAIRA